VGTQRQERYERQDAMHIVSTTLLAGYCSLLFFGTHWPWIPTQPDWFRVPHGLSLAPDKLAHIGAFALLALVVAIWYRARRPQFTWKHYATVAAILAIYAPLDELSQYLVPRRTPDVYDFIANLAGIGLGLAAFYLASLCLIALKPRRSAWH